ETKGRRCVDRRRGGWRRSLTVKCGRPARMMSVDNMPDCQISLYFTCLAALVQRVNRPSKGDQPREEEDEEATRLHLPRVWRNSGRSVGPRRRLGGPIRRRRFKHADRQRLARGDGLLDQGRGAG